MRKKTDIGEGFGNCGGAALRPNLKKSIAGLRLVLFDDLHGVSVLVLGTDDDEAVDPDALDILIDDWCAIDILRLAEIAHAKLDQLELLAGDVSGSEGDWLWTRRVVSAGHGIAYGLASRFELTTHCEVELEGPRGET